MAIRLHRDSTTLRLALAAAGAAAILGCGTTRTSNTARTATEQLLISDAVDRTVQQLDFKPLEGQTVFFDEKPLAEVVDKNYLVSSIRQHLLASGCVLKDARDQADYVVEPRVGAMGTDSHDLLFGIPALQVPQVPLAPAMPSAIPEIPFAKRRDQRGIAKLAVFAYRRDTGERVWQSGMAMSESIAKDIWLFGAGPFQRGTIYDGTRFLGNGIKDQQDHSSDAARVARLTDEAVFSGKKAAAAAPDDGAVIQASAEAPAPAASTASASAGGPPVLPPPRPLAEAPKPEDPAKTAG
ncbi:MAG: hypothetical protein DCC67_08790 [Planctomycetota bacterium]|nr:MAG: hypothetical protein DCC67_08790 [Planctomycetota bacterium]